MTAQPVELPAAGPVRVAPWHADHPPYAVGGSLYALPSEFRLAGAEALTACRCRVHADIIVGADGIHHGVSWAELATIRDQVPAARLDLHLITLDQSRPEDEQKALHAAAELAADAITLTPDAIDRQRRRVGLLRASGVQVWAEVPPIRSVADLPNDQIDAILVMLIEPGTTNTADLTQLDKIATLARQHPVGVDGGVTRQIAPDCRARGASYLVSGRDLLSVTAHSRNPITDPDSDSSTKGTT